MGFWDDFTGSSKRHIFDYMLYFIYDIQELLTGELPFSHIRSDSRVVTEIVRGNDPHTPTIEEDDVDAGLKRFMWSICLKCWTREPDYRPTIDAVLEEMDHQKVS